MNKIPYHTVGPLEAIYITDSKSLNFYPKNLDFQFLYYYGFHKQKYKKQIPVFNGNFCIG